MQKGVADFAKAAKLDPTRQSEYQRGKDNYEQVLLLSGLPIDR